MNSLNFENRVFLSRKSGDFKKTIETLSSDHKKREEFFRNLSNRSEIKTSEVCTVFAVCAAVWIAGAFVDVVAIAIAVAAAAAGVVCVGEFWDCNLETAMIDTKVDSFLYKNIV